MASCRRLRNLADERRQTRSATSTKRCLRKRRTSLHYIDVDDDSQAELMELSSQFLVSTVELERNISLTFDNLPGKALNERVKTDNTNPDALGHSLPPSMSGRSSVVSCDSYDSGVSSRSDGEPGCLPSTPEKNTPIKIAVVSPASRGVIELVDNGSEGFIGYFKPDAMHSKDLFTKPCASCSPLPRRCRVTRSISTNVSDDSCDSAFQQPRYSPLPSSKLDQNDGGDITRPSSSGNEEITISAISSKSNDKLDTVDNQRAKSPKKPIRKRNKGSSETSDKEPAKRPRKRLLSSHGPAASPRRVSTSKPSLVKRSGFAGKSALRRIQHHNRSPERSSEIMPVRAAKSLCNTRSHVKSLLKNISNTRSPTRQVHTPSHPSKHSPSSHNLKKTNSGFHAPSSRFLASPSRLHVSSGDVFGRFLSKPALSMRDGRCGVRGDGTSDEEIHSGEEDSGRLFPNEKLASNSACHWRFCKGEVSSADLVDHIERLHVASQRRNSKVYRCFWEGCKVYGQVAKSIVWLEGHVRKHLGPRPYHCIFPECTVGFSSRELLQRHVDTHIDDTEARRPARKGDILEGKKAEKKNMKRLRGTEKCIPKRTDFFTSNILEAIYWENKMLQEKWSHMLTADRSAFTLTGQIAAMSTDDSGKPKKVQLHWFPERFCVPDSWHDPHDPMVAARSKTVKISNLPRELFIDLCMHGMNSKPYHE